MKFTSLVLIGMLCFSIGCNKAETVSNPQAVVTTTEDTLGQSIQQFYLDYATAVAEGTGEQVGSLRKQWLTAECLLQVDSMVAQTGADPIIRAQDFDRNDIKTIVVKQVEGDWYVLSYISGYNKLRVMIPVKVSTQEKQLKISYISPQ